jgi:hypothetical protein
MTRDEMVEREVIVARTRYRQCHTIYQSFSTFSQVHLQILQAPPCSRSRPETLHYSTSQYDFDRRSMTLHICSASFKTILVPR